VSVFLGPVSFVLTGVVESSFIRAVATSSTYEVALMFVAGGVFVAAWWRSASAAGGGYFPYLPVTCWSLISAYFWVAIVFTHAA